MSDFSKEEAIKLITNFVKSDEKVLVTCWTEDDFQVPAEQNFRVVLTEHELELVMERTKNSFDATRGINWDVIETAIACVLEETRKKKIIK